MLVQDKILNFLKVTGPTLPAKVAKNIGSEIFIASAHLSDLASQGKVKISKLKVGGSPLYFLPGQEGQLYAFAAGNVNPKNLAVSDRLRDQKVMREAEMDLLSKVALRSMKDFATPLTVNFQGNSELFWKWHMLSSEETNQIIGTILHPPKEESVEMAIVPEKEIPEAQIETEPQVMEEIAKESEVKPEVKPSAAEPLVEKKVSTTSKPAPKEEESNEQPPVVETAPRKEKQKTLTGKLKPTRKKKATSTFFPQVEEFFTTLNVAIKEKETVRKNSELNLFVSVPSVIGTMTYFCKAKKKNKCDEKDISAAYMEAQIKKLPLLFLHTGEIHKKAQEMLDSGAFENVIIKKLE